MDSEQFRSALKMKRFRPFHVLTSSGERYKVTHPEAAWQSPGGQTIIIGLGGEDVAMLDLDHITEIVYKGVKKAQ